MCQCVDVKSINALTYWHILTYLPAKSKKIPPKNEYILHRQSKYIFIKETIHTLLHYLSRRICNPV